MAWQIGQAKITRIEEIVGPMFDPVRFFPEYDEAVFDRHAAWLYPHHATPHHTAGKPVRLIASIHSWLIETPHHKILVDTCIGNDKQRMPYRNWHQMQTAWPSNLAAAGVKVEEIDFVMCTHLHVDHVGWNTRLENGQWVPTFPNAKYIFAKQEYEFWKAEREKADPDEFHQVNNQTFDDSVLPILHLAELVEGEAALIDDLLHVTPAPGHTPGNMTLDLRSGGEGACFTGDVCHHPIQVYEPSWNSTFCEIPEMARSTRQSVLTRCADDRLSVFPAHFGPSHAGQVKSNDKGFEFIFVDG